MKYPKIKDIRTIATAPAGIDLLVVKVETDEPGLYGLGCATFTYRYRTVQHLIETYLRPLLIGREVNRITEIHQLIHQNAYWRSGPIENNAISGIDMALWDIKGKMAGMPVYELLGGKVRDGVPVYSHANGKDFDALCESIDRIRARGYRYVRCQVNTYGGDTDEPQVYGPAPKSAAKGSLDGLYLNSRTYMENALKMFEGLRVKYGHSFEILHDVHERIHPTEALEFCHQADPYRLFFLEDVVSPENIDWLKEIHNHCTTPLSHGELDVHLLEWKKPVMEHSVDYVRAHLSDIGGITAARKMQMFADGFAVRTCWHGPGDMSPIAKAANIHLDLASQNFGLQEWSEDNDNLKEVFPGAPQYGGDGFVYASDAPGLGVDLNEEAAAKFPCHDGVTTWTQTRNKDGSLQTP